MVGVVIPPAIFHRHVDHGSSVTLLKLLSNTLVLDNITAYLSLSSIIALSRTSLTLKSLILNTPGVFRHLDLSRCRGAYVPPDITPIDSGGYSWRSQRMDENLTEDEFHAGPLRGVFSKLSRMLILRDVQVLVLDGLGSVTLDLVSEIIMGKSYDVRILSVVGCANLNQRQLQQLLCYICRPSRPEGSPRLKGLYVFGTKDTSKGESRVTSSGAGRGVISAEGAQLGGRPLFPQSLSESSDPWYSPSGRVLPQTKERRSSWEETLQVCQGIIAFDAILCLQMHNTMAPYLQQSKKEALMEKPTVPPLASIALGPQGCAGCGRVPKGTLVWGRDDVMKFPLLRPPPLSGKIIDAVRPPAKFAEGRSTSQGQRLVVSCPVCVADRHCESCHRWWCAECFELMPAQTSYPLPTDVLTPTTSSLPLSHGLESSGLEGDRMDSGIQAGSTVKVSYNLCVERCLVGEMMAGAGSNGMWA